MPRTTLTTSDEPEAAVSLEQWAEANGYDRKTRSYAKTEAPDGAVPGGHCGSRRSDVGWKVA